MTRKRKTSTKFHRELVRAAEAIVLPAGGTLYFEHQERTAKHPKLHIALGDRSISLTISCTPKNADTTMRMKLGQVRRFLRGEAS